MTDTTREPISIVPTATDHQCFESRTFPRIYTDNTAPQMRFAAAMVSFVRSQEEDTPSSERTIGAARHGAQVLRAFVQKYPDFLSEYDELSRHVDYLLNKYPEEETL